MIFERENAAGSPAPTFAAEVAAPSGPTESGTFTTRERSGSVRRVTR
jgi:hypothetical protein